MFYQEVRLMEDKLTNELHSIGCGIRFKRNFDASDYKGIIIQNLCDERLLRIDEHLPKVADTPFGFIIGTPNGTDFILLNNQDLIYKRQISLDEISIETFTSQFESIINIIEKHLKLKTVIRFGTVFEFAFDEKDYFQKFKETFLNKDFSSSAINLNFSKIVESKESKVKKKINHYYRTNINLEAINRSTHLKFDYQKFYQPRLHEISQIKFKESFKEHHNHVIQCIGGWL